MGSGQKEPVFEPQVVSYRNEGERIRVQNRCACGKAVQYLSFRRLQERRIVRSPSGLPVPRSSSWYCIVIMLSLIGSRPGSRCRSSRFPHIFCLSGILMCEELVRSRRYRRLRAIPWTTPLTFSFLPSFQVGNQILPAVPRRMRSGPVFAPARTDAACYRDLGAYRNASKDD